ncbi:MAG: hypothetical protein ACRBN8_26965 [Nannocystales bacterium]
MSALDQCVEAASLASGQPMPLRSFTASVEAGVLAMRRTSEPWLFATSLLRCGLCVAPRVVARVRNQELDGHTTLQLDLRFSATQWEWPDLSALLDASIRDDIRVDGPERWRFLAGRAVNGAMASQPRWVELHTPAGARRWTWSAGASQGRDPYEVQRIHSDVEDDGVSLRVSHQAQGVAAVWARWTGRHAPLAQVAALWSKGLGRPVTEEALGDGVVVERLDPTRSEDFGPAGCWWAETDGGLHLRREGVRVASLPDVTTPDGELLHGDLDAPKLRLDADGHRVHLDDAWHEVVAWLHASAQPRSREIPKVVVDWQGHPRAVETLRDTDEVVFAWPHRLEADRGALWAVESLSPPQLAWLREHTEARFIPASPLASGKLQDRVDAAALEAGSVGPVSLGDVLSATVRGYIHRHPIATRGVVEVHGFGRKVLKGEALELPGITVVAELSDGDVNEERATEVAAAACNLARERADVLTQAVLQGLPDDASRVRAPWFNHRWDQLGPLDIALRYVPHGAGVLLKWRDEPLLQITVAHGRDGTPYSGSDALKRLRDVGGIVIAQGGGRWHTLESSDPAWVPWELTGGGATLLKKLVGAWGLWRMPMVAEAQLRPGPLASQSHVRLSAARSAELVPELRAHGRSRERARMALLAHLLWARMTGEPTHGLETVPVLVAYDPQSAMPRAHVSLGQLVASGSYATVLPGGAGHRELAHPVIEAEPAVADALVELGLLSCGSFAAGGGTRTRTAAAPPKAPRRVWLRQPVADAMAVGALTVAEGSAGVELWADGLRNRTLVLPAPYGSVSGRVWLQGQVSEPALVRLLHSTADALLETARRVVLLAVPGSERARALQTFVDSIPVTLGAAGVMRRVAPVLGSDRLGATLRFALGRAPVIEVSRLSWSLLRDDEGLELVRLGGLHPLVRAAREDGADATAIGAAALFALFELHRAGRLDQLGFDEGLTRVLAALE